MSDDESRLWPAARRLLGIRIAPANALITERNVAKTGIALILSGLGGLVLVFTYSQPRQWSLAVTAVLVAAAALTTGFLLGFLFGIPRSRREASGAIATTGTSATSPSTYNMSSAPSGANDHSITEGRTASVGRLTVNANLEEISDWLTKIIVGVGLIELNNIPTNLDRMARYVAAGLVSTPAAAPPVAFALATIVYFSILGFLSGYLLTRLFLAGAFSAADYELDQLRGEVEKKTQEVKREKERVDQVIKGADESARTKETAPVIVDAPAPIEPQSPPGERLVALEAKYKTIRDTQLAGEERSRQMRAVFGELRALAPRLADFDVVAVLRSPQREARLAAHAVILEQPKPEYLAPLVDSLVTYSAHKKTGVDNRPFGEYWGIQALDRVMSVTKMPMSDDLLKKLVDWSSSLPKGTDRWFEMVRIFKRYGIDAQL